MRVDQRTFRAMGCECEVVIASDDITASDVEIAVRRLDTKWSRFVPTSELMNLNANAGSVVAVSTPTLQLLAAMELGWQLTDGRYDPTLGSRLLELGYTRDFRSGPAPIDQQPYRSGFSTETLNIDLVHGTAQLAEGYTLDAGGIGKGLAADLIVDDVLMRGAEAVLVNLGGDLRVGGDVSALGEALWTIDIERYDSDEIALTLQCDHGGLATSGTQTRRWHWNGAEVHHVIDPRTQAPAVTDLCSVSVLSGAAWQAEVIATAVLIDGSGSVQDWCDRTGAEIVGQRADGTLVMSTGLLVAEGA